MLNDTIIDAAQFLMKKQFTDPKIEGFQSVLNKQRVTSFKKVENDMIQILHRGSPGLGHLLTISNLNCQEGTVNVFDSFYNDIDKESKLQIANILKPTGKNIKFNIIPVQCQAGGTECGLFAIAFAVALGLGFNPTKLLFKQESMRGHLIDCLTKQEFSNFPFSINTNWRKKKTVIIRENIFLYLQGPLRQRNGSVHQLL